MVVKIIVLYFEEMGIEFFLAGNSGETAIKWLIRRGYEEFALFGMGGDGYSNATLDRQVETWSNRSDNWSVGRQHECMTSQVFFALNIAFTAYGRHCNLRHERLAKFYQQQCPSGFISAVQNTTLYRKSCKEINKIISQ